MKHMRLFKYLYFVTACLCITSSYAFVTKVHEAMEIIEERTKKPANKVFLDKIIQEVIQKLGSEYEDKKEYKKKEVNQVLEIIEKVLKENNIGIKKENNQIYLINESFVAKDKAFSEKDHFDVDLNSLRLIYFSVAEVLNLDMSIVLNKQENKEKIFILFKTSDKGDFKWDIKTKITNPLWLLKKENNTYYNNENILEFLYLLIVKKQQEDPNFDIELSYSQSLYNHYITKNELAACDSISQKVKDKYNYIKETRDEEISISMQQEDQLIIEGYTKRIKKDPENSNLYFGRATSLLNLKKKNVYIFQIIKDFNKALQLDPKNQKYEAKRLEAVDILKQMGTKYTIPDSFEYIND